MTLRLCFTNHEHTQEVRWPQKATDWVIQFNRKFSWCVLLLHANFWLLLWLPAADPVPLLLQAVLAHKVQGCSGRWLWWGFAMAQASAFSAGWVPVSGSGFQSGWKKRMSNVRAQFSKTRFSVMKRWWLPLRPRSWEMYIVHSSGPKGS